MSMPSRFCLANQGELGCVTAFCTLHGFSQHVLLCLWQHGLGLLHLLHGLCCHHSQYLHQDDSGVQKEPHQGIRWEPQGSPSAPPVLHTANKQLLWAQRQGLPFSLWGSRLLYWSAAENTTAGTRAGPRWSLGPDSWGGSLLGISVHGKSSGVWEAQELWTKHWHHC